MDTAPTIVEPATLPTAFVEEMRLASHFAGAFRAKITLLAYESDWRVFAPRFCAERGLEALPATEAALWRGLVRRLADLAELADTRRRSARRFRDAAPPRGSGRELDRRCGAIKWRLAVPIDSEATKAVIGGIKCAIGVSPVRKHSVMSEIAIFPAGLERSRLGTT
jgi:hypothetical protein